MLPEATAGDKEGRATLSAFGSATRTCCGRSEAAIHLRIDDPVFVGDEGRDEGPNEMGTTSLPSSSLAILCCGLDLLVQRS